MAAIFDGSRGLKSLSVGRNFWTKGAPKNYVVKLPGELESLYLGGQFNQTLENVTLTELTKKKTVVEFG